MFGAPPGQRIGEVWFTGGGELPLLAKYIFTSERLSIQVHPDDEQARARAAEGKSECWYILDAEPGATIGLGPHARAFAATSFAPPRSTDRSSSWSTWRPVRAGDFFFVPPGTIHAIGGGLSLLEFQQNADVTYRLYDYGRPRELHLDEARRRRDRRRIATQICARHLAPGDEQLLVDGPAFHPGAQPRRRAAGPAALGHPARRPGAVGK